MRARPTTGAPSLASLTPLPPPPLADAAYKQAECGPCDKPKPAAHRFRARLRGAFEEVLVSATVWRNVPPAFVYVCRRPVG